MSKASMFLWLKYTLAAAAFFVAAGFILKVAAEGFTPNEAFAILLEVGLYQSILYAMVVATVLTVGKS